MKGLGEMIQGDASVAVTKEFLFWVSSGELSIILNSLSFELIPSAIYVKTSYEMWNDLKDTYDKFDAMISLHPSTCEAAKHFKKHNQLIKLMQFLMGLDDSYFAIQSNILTREPLPSIKATFAVVSDKQECGIGKQFNGHYLFDVDNACKIVFNNCIASCFVSMILWHQRLGYPVDQVLNALNTTLNLDSHSISDHLCDTCNKAKQTREPFPLSEHKSTKTGRVSSNDDGIELSPDIQGNDDSEATSMEENNTHPKGTVPNETDFVNDFYENLKFNSEVEDLPFHTVKRSSRQTKLPTSVNDFVIEGKVKYGVEKVVNYANLNHDNICFASGLNKTICNTPKLGRSGILSPRRVTS
nr:hypothetical protein [Tanacetum cinerariifolium]